VIRAMVGPEEQREFLLWDGRCFAGLTRPWPSALTRPLTEQNTPPTITPMSTTMVVEEVSPIQPSLANLAKLPRQRPSLTRRRPAFSPTNSGSALESYYRCRSQARDARDAMTDKCFARYCGSWTPALRGGIYQRRSLVPIARLTVGTANGAKKGSGPG
jgi:hypothetical protein